MSASVTLEDSAKSSAEARTIRGTVLRILHDGGEGKDWRAMIQEGGSRLPTYVRGPISPPDVQPGDDVFLIGQRTASGNPDVPDECVVSPTRAGDRIALALAHATTLSVKASARRDGGELPLTPAYKAALDEIRGGLARLEIGRGIIVLARSRRSVDPAVEWGRKLFAGAAGLRGMVLLLEPASVFPERAPVALGILETLRRSWHPGNRPIDRVSDLLGRFLSGIGGLRAGAQGAVRSVSLQASNWSNNAGAGFGSTGLNYVIPYNPAETGLDAWRSMSHSYAGFLPKALMSPEAQAMITTAHELAHAHQFGYGITIKGNASEEARQRGVAEGFADATALMAFVTRTGDERNAMLWAASRAVATLNDNSGYNTGAICVEAIREARKLREEYGAVEVPITEIMTRANGIASRKSLEQHTLVDEAVAEIKQGWQRLAPEKMRDAILGTALAIENREWPDAVEQEKVVELLRLAANAITKTCYTPFELKDRKKLGKAASVIRNDLAATGDWLSRIGLGGARPHMLTNAIKTCQQQDDLPARKAAFWLSWKIADVAGPAASYIQNGLMRELAGLFVMADRAGRSVGVSIFPRPGGNGFAGLRATREVLAQASTELRAYKGAVGISPDAAPMALLGLENGVTGRGNPFDQTVDERLKRLSKLSERMGADASQAGPLTDSDLFLVNRRREMARDLAMSLRVDTECWKIVKKLAGNDVLMVDAITAAASCGPLLPSDFPMKKVDAAASKLWVGMSAIRNNAVWTDLQRHRLFLANHKDLDGRQLDWNGRDLRGCHLAGADLRWGVIKDCTFATMDLTRVKIEGAAVEGCDFSLADLSGARFAGTRIANTSFDGARGLSLDGAHVVADAHGFDGLEEWPVISSGEIAAPVANLRT